MECYNVAIVSEYAGIDAAGLARVTSAIQKQVVRDFGPIWDVTATVSAFPRLEDVPTGYWTIRITAEDLGGELGLHYDEAGQPHATIAWSDSWSISASHECLEMLVDPWGNRVRTGHSPKGGSARVQFLVEICDPCQNAKYAYPVNDTLVSDFYTPAYFDALARPDARYSFTGAIKAPLSILEDGYLSWVDPQTGEWWQTNGAGQHENLGRLNPFAGTLREQINGRTADHLSPTRLSQTDVLARVGESRRLAKQASITCAGLIRNLRTKKGTP